MLVYPLLLQNTKTDRGEWHVCRRAIHIRRGCGNARCRRKSGSQPKIVRAPPLTTLAETSSRLFFLFFPRLLRCIIINVSVLMCGQPCTGTCMQMVSQTVSCVCATDADVRMSRFVPKCRFQIVFYNSTHKLTHTHTTRTHIHTHAVLLGVFTGRSRAPCLGDTLISGECFGKFQGLCARKSPKFTALISQSETQRGMFSCNSRSPNMHYTYISCYNVTDSFHIAYNIHVSYCILHIPFILQHTHTSIHFGAGVDRVLVHENFSDLF